MWSYIESGKREGAKILAGGERREGKGYFVEPTGKATPRLVKEPGLSRVAHSFGEVFADVNQDMKIVSQQRNSC